MVDAAPAFGANQEMQFGTARGVKQVVEIGLTVGHGDDGAVRGQGLGRGRQCRQPALTLLVGRVLAPTLAAFAEVRRIACPDFLMKHPEGDTVGIRDEDGVDAQTGRFQVAEIAQGAGGGMGGEVQQGGILESQDRPLGGQAFAGALLMSGADGLRGNAVVVPEAIGAFDSGPGAEGLRDAGRRLSRQGFDQMNQASGQALVSELNRG